MKSTEDPWFEFNAQKNEMLSQLRKCSFAEDIIVFGSLATGKEFPGDIDVFLDRSTVAMEEFIFSQPASYLLAFSRKFYGSFDPFVLVSQGGFTGEMKPLLITRNDQGTGWIKSKNSREIIRDTKVKGVPLLSVGNLKTAKEGYNEDGYWVGTNGGASGVLPIAKSTGRICLAWRNSDVQQGDCFGTIGGACKDGMSPAESATAEMREETGYKGGMTLHPAYIFTDGNFQYANFVGICNDEFSFQPMEEHAWETDFIEWHSLEEIQQGMKESPTDYHPGLVRLFKESLDLIEHTIEQSTGRSKAATLSESLNTMDPGLREKLAAEHPNQWMELLLDNDEPWLHTASSFPPELKNAVNIVEKKIENFDPETDEETGDYGRCTYSALELQGMVGGIVYGFFITENPDAGFDIDHDFLLVNDRYLLDPWAAVYPMEKDMYDLRDESDATEVLRLYGPKEKWNVVSAQAKTATDKMPPMQDDPNYVEGTNGWALHPDQRE